MKKIILGILVILILISGYVFIKDQKNRIELSKIEESKTVDPEDVKSPKIAVDSENNITRVNGIWAVDSNGKYSIDSKSLKFQFIGYKPGGQHIGTFDNMKIDVAFDGQGNPVGSVISIDVDSIKTESEKLDIHLKSADFFNMEKYPIVSIAVKSIEKTNGTSTKALTEISMLGITKNLSIPVSINQLDGGTKFNIDTKINIADFGMKYGPVLSDVRILVEGVIKKDRDIFN